MAMAMLKRTISIGRTRGGLSYRSLSSGKFNHVDTLGRVKGQEAINVPSTQAETLTGGLELVMEKVKAYIAKSEVTLDVEMCFLYILCCKLILRNCLRYVHLQQNRSPWRTSLISFLT